MANNTFMQPKDYNEVQAEGGYRPLPKGGYLVRIMKAELTNSKSGKPMIHIAYDICEGEYANYFNNLFKSRKSNSDRPLEVKYPFEGQKWITVFDNEGKTNRDFKGFCTALEDSGIQVWNSDKSFNMASLNGAVVGLIFRKEEHEYNGNVSWRTVPWRFRSVGIIESDDYFIPEDKELEQQNNYSTVQNGFNAPQTNLFDMPGVDNFSAAEDDIPF